MNTHLALALVILAGGLNGSWALPMKLMHAWKWENAWLIYSVIGMIVAPWALALWTVPELATIYHRASWHVLALVFGFGLGSGLGSMLFGLGIARVGLALGFSIVLGIMASAGALVPMAILHSAQLWGPQGQKLLLGTLLVIIGVSLYAIAGRRREREKGLGAQLSVRSAFGAGLAICIASALLSTLLNFSFLYGSELQKLAVISGTKTKSSANPIWALALSASFIANGAYAIYLLQRNRSWALFHAASSAFNYLGGIWMGVFWFGSVALYGIGATDLGDLGGIIAWPILMSMIIFTANAWGMVMKEWVHTSRRSVAYAYGGMASLLVAIYVISLANRP